MFIAHAYSFKHAHAEISRLRTHTAQTHKHTPYTIRLKLSAQETTVKSLT